VEPNPNSKSASVVGWRLFCDNNLTTT